MREKFLLRSNLKTAFSTASWAVCFVLLFAGKNALFAASSFTEEDAPCDAAMSGTVYVGTGAGSPSYAGFKQLFDDINANGISSNLLVLVQNDVSETATAVLNTVVECSGSGFEINIRPVDGTVRTITRANSGALMQLNGVTNLTIDGSFGGSGRFLCFRNAVTNQSALILGGGTNNCEFRNSIFEASGATAYVIRLGTGSGLAVTDILIDGNDIRNCSNLAQTAASKCQIGLVSQGASASQLNRDITISNNLFSRFIQSGIDIGTSLTSSNNIVHAPNSLAGNNVTTFNGTYNGSNFTIQGNRFFEPIANTANQMTIPIKFNPGTSSYSNLISGNIIGGNTETNTGTWTNPILRLMAGMLISVGGTTDAEATVISENTIHRIYMSGTGQGYSFFSGIYVFGVSRVTIQENVIGSLTETNSILSSGNGWNTNFSNYTSHVYPIYNYSTALVEIIGNVIANVTSNSTTGITNTCGIRNGVRENLVPTNINDGTLFSSPVAGQVKVRDNIVTALTSPSRCYRLSGNSAAVPAQPGGLCGIMVMSNAVGSEVVNNEVSNLLNTVPGAPSMTLARATVVVGISMDGSALAGNSATGIVDSNRIYDLKNDHQANGGVNDRPEIIGISLGMLISITNSGTTQGRGNYTLTNNMISLAPVIPANSTMVVGIMDQIQSPNVTRVYNNTVYIGGSGLNSLHPSAAFFHFPNRNRACTDGQTYVENNIFINERTGMTNAFAMASLVNGTPVITSNNNFLASNVAGQTGSWQGTAGNLTAWQTNSGGGDANSASALVVATGSSSTDINPNELFENKLNDLHIADPPVSPWPLNFVAGTGTPIASVTTDIDGDPRSLSAPFLGADEAAASGPTIDTQPQSSIVGCTTGVTQLTVAATNATTYQWQVSTDNGNNWSNVNNGGKYSGANTATLTITNATMAMSGYRYQVIVTDASSNSVTSSPSTLTVQVCPTDNDPSWNNATLGNVSYVYPNVYNIQGSTAGTTPSVEDGDPLTGTNDIWYQFTAISNGVSIRVSSDVIEPNIFLFSGAYNDLTLVNSETIVATNGPTKTAVLNFGGLTEGQTYRIAIGAASGPDGAFNICLQQLRKASCNGAALGTPSLCSSIGTTPTGATTTTYSFTGGGSASSSGLMLLSTPALALAYGAAYPLSLTANYDLHDAAGLLETISVANANACMVTIGAHTLVEVKLNQRCPATLYRSGYLMGTPSVCGATGYEVEFTPVDNCAGDNPVELETFSKTITGASPSIYLSYAFGDLIPVSSYPYAGHWAVKWRPLFVNNTVAGTYGNAQTISVNSTSVNQSMVLEPVSNNNTATTALTSNVSFGLYPNPNTGDMVNLNITGITSDNVFVRIMDSMGRVIYSNRYAVEGSLNTIVTFSKPLASGLYMVEFTSDGEVMTQRMMVTR